LESAEGKKNIVRIAKQMAKERQDVVGVNCLISDGGNIVIDPDEIKNEWKRYMEKLLNEKNVWDRITDYSSVLRPRPIITEAEVMAAIKGMKQGKAAGPSKVVAEMFRDGGDVGVKCLTVLCNIVVVVVVCVVCHKLSADNYVT
jgi:hypothetical protein